NLTPSQVQAQRRDRITAAAKTQWFAGNVATYLSLAGQTCGLSCVAQTQEVHPCEGAGQSYNGWQLSWSRFLPADRARGRGITWWIRATPAPMARPLEATREHTTASSRRWAREAC